ncbi:MAG: hypothetical protein ACRD82_00980 [Blastocatellia bacterium]
MSILSGSNVIFAFTFLCLVGIGVHAYLPVFWTWPSRFLAASAAAAAVGLINSFGNLGGYFGPKVVGYLSVAYSTTRMVLQVNGETKTEIVPNYVLGQWFLVVCIFVAGLLAMLLKEPRKKDQVLASEAE